MGHPMANRRSRVSPQDRCAKDCALPSGVPTGTLAPPQMRTAGRNSGRIWRVAHDCARSGIAGLGDQTGLDKRFATAPPTSIAGRDATEGGDEHGGVKSTSAVRAPASRTGPNGGTVSRGPPCDRRGAYAKPSTQPNPPFAARVCAAPSSPAHAAPLIGERAGMSGRIATEGGDEHAGVERRYAFALQPREPDRAARTVTRLATRPTEARTPKRVTEPPTDRRQLDLRPVLPQLRMLPKS
jgi:hypothetical protein